MIEQLEQLCLAVSIVNEPDAKQVVEAVNRRVKALVNAQIVKLYWRQEAEIGVILRPVAYINEGQTPDPQPFALRDTSRGILEWAYLRGQPLWLEDLTANRHEATVPNRATGIDIPCEELELGDPPQSDSTIVVPIVERGEVRGLYSVELQTSGRLSPQILSLLKRLSKSLGTLLFTADHYAYDLRKTGTAIARFLDAIQNFTFDPVLRGQNWRTAFVARPFGSEFDPVQKCVESVLGDQGIRARHFVAETQSLVVDEVLGQIRNSHFCVSDITGGNANVVAELGMMIALRKRFLPLRRRGERVTIPFNLHHVQVWEYELGNHDELLVFEPAENRLVAFRDIVERFVRNLPPEFHMATPWDAKAQDRSKENGRVADRATTPGTPP